jgi:hypothetical protein
MEKIENIRTNVFKENQNLRTENKYLHDKLKDVKKESMEKDKIIEELKKNLANF